MGLFTIAAPRLMGPELFGQLAVILSISGLFSSASTLGGRYALGRFMPDYISRNALPEARALFMHVLQFRLALALVAALPLYELLRHVLPDASRVTLTASVLAFMVAAISSPMFGGLYALNRLGSSMSGTAVDRFLLLAILIVVGGTSSLERAGLAVLATQLCVFIGALFMARGLFTLNRKAFDLRSAGTHIRFGVVVFAANLLLRMPWRLGESALALAAVDSSEIAFFNIAISATVAFTRIVGGTATLLIPSLSLKQVAGDESGRDHSLGLALRYLSIASGLFVLSVLAAAPWAVPMLLGESFGGVVPNLVVIAWAVLPVPYIRTALALEVVRDRLARNLLLGATAISVFGACAFALIPRFASLGASVAVVLAIWVAGAVAILQLRPTRVLEEARNRRHLLAAAGPFALVVLTKASPVAAMIGAVGYGIGLLAFGVVSRRELRQLATRRS